jgi:hypothetical protein
MLSSIILSGNFELIRDAIGQLLTAEFANQKSLCDALAEAQSEESGDDVVSSGIAINTYLERTTPIDKEELPLVNIIYSDTDFSNESTSFTSVGDNKYLIEVYVSGVSNSAMSGDKKAAFLLAKIMGMIRTILMNDQNLFLGFSDKFIQGRRVKSMTRTAPRIANDSLNTLSGTLEVHYLAEETTELGEGTLENLLDTVVKLSTTEKGYKYEIINT